MRPHPRPSVPARVVALAVLAVVLAGCGATASTGPSPTPQVASRLSTFVGEGFTFAYPSSWSMLSGFEHFGLHGPTVMGAVGIGGFDAGCTVDSSSVSCPADPVWSVPSDGVVVVYRFGAWLGPIVPAPSETPGPGERSVEVGGRIAFRIDGPASIRIRFPGAPEYIEARWGAASADAATTIDEVLAGWTWTSPPIR